MKYRVIIRTTDSKKYVARLKSPEDGFVKFLKTYVHNDWANRTYVSFDYVDAGVYHGFNPANIASITVKAGWWF